MNGQYIWVRPWQVTIGQQDVTRLLDTLTFSNVDPGGFEACSVSLRSPVAAPRAGDRVTVRYGLETVWDGRVNDPGNASNADRQVEAVQAVGYGAELKDAHFRDIYRDIDLSRWKGGSAARRDALIAALTFVDPGQVRTGAFTQTVGPASNGPPGPLADAWYDAENIEIASVYYAWTRGTGLDNTNTNYTWQVVLSSDDIATSTNLSGNLRAAGPGSGTLTASSTAKYFAVVDFFYNATTGLGAAFDLKWTTLAVYGNHGLTKRGSEPTVGFYPTDVAADILNRHNTVRVPQGAKRIELGPVDTDSTAYAIQHLVYRGFTTYEQGIDDMVRKQLGWHWGVWEPAGLHSDAPRLFMTKPPTSATASVSRADLGDDFDAPRVRLDLLYGAALVEYTDSAGRYGAVAITDAGDVDALLSQAGVGTEKTLLLNAGTSTAAAATAFGQFALALAGTAARGAGSATIPETVATPSGRKPAVLLKAGRDRLRITDLPDPGPLHETDTRRFDTFHVRRVETTVDAQGVPQTRVELGSGADLLEVLQARQAAALVNLG